MRPRLGQRVAAAAFVLGFAGELGAEQARAFADDRPAPADGAAPAQAQPRGDEGLRPPPADRSEASDLVPERSVQVRVVDGDGAPLAGVRIRLGVRTQAVGEADVRTERFLESDEQGAARFSDLALETQTSYRVTVDRDGARFASPPFRLESGRGHDVLLHLHPVTSDVRRAQVGMTGIVYLALRENDFHGEVYLRVYNVGRTTWLANEVLLGLPSGFRSFETRPGMMDAGFREARERGAFLEGTFPPGQQQLAFTFRMPRQAGTRQSFDFALPPHVAELTVVAAQTPGMSLEVPGFEPAEPGVQNQERILVSRKAFSHAGGPIARVTVTLSGLPGLAWGRWLVAGVSVLAATAGLLSALRSQLKRTPRREHSRRLELERAREILLKEVVELENAKRLGNIGPRTYEQARARLVLGLVRLADLTPTKPPENASESEGSRAHRLGISAG